MRTDVSPQFKNRSYSFFLGCCMLYVGDVQQARQTNHNFCRHQFYNLQSTRNVGQCPTWWSPCWI